MKTLIFNGSPKKTGDTERLINAFTKHLHGEIRTISFFDDINPCMDCRDCWSKQGCTINDGMQEIYAYLHACDNVVLASPIWFSSLSGPLLNMASRLQTLWAGRYFRKEKTGKAKNGVLIIVGAEEGTEVIPTETALTIMKHMHVKLSDISKIYSCNTNILPAEKDEMALQKCREAAIRLNDICGIGSKK